MMFKSILLTALLLSSTVTSAQAAPSDLTITSTSITEIDSFTPVPLELPTSDNAIGDIITSIDGMIAVGQKIWKIVEAGRPVVTTKFSPGVSVLPQTQGENPTLNQMSNWSAPVFRTYRVSFKNNASDEVVGFNYTIYFQANGSYRGQGKYIANLKVDASEIYAAWLFNVDATSELVGVANIGTDTAPVASAIMQLSYAVKGPFNEIRKVKKFYVDGVGNIQTIP